MEDSKLYHQTANETIMLQCLEMAARLPNVMGDADKVLELAEKIYAAVKAKNGEQK